MGDYMRMFIRYLSISLFFLFSFFISSCTLIAPGNDTDFLLGHESSGGVFNSEVSFSYTPSDTKIYKVSIRESLYFALGFVSFNSDENTFDGSEFIIELYSDSGMSNLLASYVSNEPVLIHGEENIYIKIEYIGSSENSSNTAYFIARVIGINGWDYYSDFNLTIDEL